MAVLQEVGGGGVKGLPLRIKKFFCGFKKKYEKVLTADSFRGLVKALMALSLNFFFATSLTFQATRNLATHLGGNNLGILLGRIFGLEQQKVKNHQTF